MLDEVSPELERTVAYLEAVTVQALTIDLITLTVYDVNGVQVALPQRISPDLSAASSLTTPGKTDPRPSPSHQVCRRRCLSSFHIGGHRRRPRRIREIDYMGRAAGLASKRAPALQRGHQICQPWATDNADNDGLVTIWNDNQKPQIAVYRSMFERHAPNSIESVEQVIAPIEIGNGNYVRNITPETLEALTAALSRGQQGLIRKLCVLRVVGIR